MIHKYTVTVKTDEPLTGEQIDDIRARLQYDADQLLSDIETAIVTVK